MAATCSRPEGTSTLLPTRRGCDSRFVGTLFFAGLGIVHLSRLSTRCGGDRRFGFGSEVFRPAHGLVDGPRRDMNEIGEIRPTQLIYTFGVGSLVDLPNMSALVMGLDDWNTQYCREIQEDRLIAAIQRRLGPQVSQLYLPHIKLDDMKADPSAPAIGVPVASFPRWMRCSLCDTLATVDSGVFRLKQDP